MCNNESMLIRKQVLFTPEIDLYIQSLSQQYNKSYSATLRDVILKVSPKETKKHENFLDSMAKLKLTGGPKNLSKNIDKYLYQQ
jgi:hypothetical protein